MTPSASGNTRWPRSSASGEAYHRGMSPRAHLFAATLAFALAACSSGGGGDASPAAPGETVLQWTPQLAVLSRSPIVVSGSTYYSSTQLEAAWGAPSNVQPSRYDVAWTDAGTSRQENASSSTPTVVLTGLKASTSYRIDVTVCTATRCFPDQKASIVAMTPAEVWQLQGTGNTAGGLRRIVSDGNVQLHVMQYGADALAGLAARLQLYYNPIQQGAKGVATAMTSAPASASSPSTYLDFASRAGSTGLINPASAAPLVRDAGTAQGVPLTAALGARVRLFFAALGSDGKSRILSLDSQDGYAGADFNTGLPTVCSAAADYAAGGPCAPSVVVGVEGDAAGANARIVNARQFKIGYPTRASWLWDGAPGTFMVFTTDPLTGCSSVQMNHAYAVWSGTSWVVQYAANGCPKHWQNMQAAHPLHLGAGRYKMYYGDTSDVSARPPGAQFPFLGRKRLIYADATLTGDPARVEFEDWEATSSGRRLVLLWPNGDGLDAATEGFIDDFSVVAIGGALDLQVLYVAITDGTVPPFAAAAVLLNP